MLLPFVAIIRQAKTGLIWAVVECPRDVSYRSVIETWLKANGCSPAKAEEYYATGAPMIPYQDLKQSAGE